MARFFFIKHKNSDEFKILSLKKKINLSRKSKYFKSTRLNKNFSYILSDNIKDSSKLFEMRIIYVLLMALLIMVKNYILLKIF